MTQLQSIAPDLWQVGNDVFMPGGVHFPGRMLVLRLADDALVLWSPVPVDDALAAALQALGTVRWIVAPCLFHHLFVAAASERWPDAAVLACPGMDEKRPDLRIDGVLPADAPAEWAGALDLVLVEGVPMLNEVVVRHRTSGSLIVTDLVFHLHEYRGWLTGLVLWLVGARRRLAQSRSVRLMTRDRAAAAASAERILALDFERLVMAHGRIVDTGGHAALAEALRPMRRGGQPALEVGSPA